MTRETKAGLVVSCSFLCLVGAVVTVKLRQPSAEVAQADKPDDQKAAKPDDAHSEHHGKGKAASAAPADPALNIQSGKEPAGSAPVTLPGIPSTTDVRAPQPGGEGAGEHGRRGKSPPVPDEHVKPASANEPEPVPGAGLPLPPAVPVAPSGAGTAEIPIPVPSAGTPAPPPPGGVPLSGAEVKPEGVSEKEKAGKEEGGKEKQGHKREPGEKAKPENGQDKPAAGLRNENPAAPVLDAPPPPTGAALPPPGAATPPANGEPPPHLMKEHAGDGAASEKREPGRGEHKEMPPPINPAEPPPLGGAGPKPAELSPPPGSPPVGAVPVPTAPLAPPVSGGTPPLTPVGGTPLPPIGGMPAADEKGAHGSPPLTGKPEAQPPGPTPIGSRPAVAPAHSDFIPDPPSPGSEPTPAASPAAVPGAAGNASGVVLDPIRPMAVGAARGTEPGSTGFSRPPAGTPAPIGSPTGVPAPVYPAVSPSAGMAAQVTVPSDRAPAPLPAPAPLTPIGTPITSTTPPIRLPESLPAQPLTPAEATTQVVTYQETRHSVVAADSFQSLSKEYYGNDSYAVALQMWNKTHPRASDTMAREGKLVPGDKVFIPPTTQLERHYPALIPGLKAAAPTGGTVQTSFTGDPPATAAIPIYKVVKAESVEVIARQTLGSGDKATELLRLNTPLRAGELVPAGTLLMLPAGAQVPYENIPR